MKRYNYTWTVIHFTTESQYLNGQNEINIRVSITEKLIGTNI